MEKPNLPNSTLILVFGILSILTCCCYGILGLIFGIVALVLAKKAKQVYLAEPDIYKGYGNVKTGRILAIIGITLSVIYLLLIIFVLSFYGIEELERMNEEFMREYGGAQF